MKVQQYQDKEQHRDRVFWTVVVFWLSYVCCKRIESGSVNHRSCLTDVGIRCDNRVSKMIAPLIILTEFGLQCSKGIANSA